MYFSGLFGQSCYGQTRIIQWSDSHSTIESISHQVNAIDNAGTEFLKAHPQGEVIIYVLGDHISISPFNALEGGWLSIEALGLLRTRGYTVLFTPGNHDAFDWTEKIDGTQLFLEQMQQLKRWGVKILVTNLRKKTAAFQRLTTPSYSLKKSGGQIEIVGLTIPNIMAKSNLTDVTAARLFGKIESYPETFKRVLNTLVKDGVEQVVFAIHAGHVEVSKKARFLKDFIAQHELPVTIPLMLGAHDHRAASYKVGNTHVSDGASHGSFNIIDFDKRGRLLSKDLRHVALTEEKAHEIEDKNFRVGQIEINQSSRQQIKNKAWLSEFDQKVEEHISRVGLNLSRILAELRLGIPEHKQHLKAGPSLLGDLVAETLVRWTQDILPGAPLHDIVAMTNSSSYRLEEGIKPGPLSELLVRNIYPFHSDAVLYLLDGQELRDMYFSLRDFYSTADKSLFTPQLNLTARERNGELQILSQHNQWIGVDDNKKYWVAIDGWLAEHRYGQSYRISEWLEIMQNKAPRAKESYQDLLVRYLPQIFLDHEHRFQQPLATNSCRMIFAR